MPIDLSRRSYRKELLDEDNIPFADIRRNMRELDFINTWLGGHAISVAGLRRVFAGRREISICEMGCGGGDNLRALRRWGDKNNVVIQVIGIDLNPHCIEVAKEGWKDGQARWIASDYRQVDFGAARPDIIFSSLFCHHFTDDELISQLKWMECNAVMGWFVNDLHRHRLAWLSIKWLTGWFSRSYLVRNDAPLSVLRGFTRKEWQALIRQADIDHCKISWKWAFRWLITKSFLVE